MDPTNQFQGRWKREATEAELRRVLATKGLEYVEWPYWNVTFFRDLPNLIIVRTNLTGGDVRDVHGGWRYDNDILLRIDWEEIKRIAEMFKQQGIV